MIQESKRVTVIQISDLHITNDPKKMNYLSGSGLSEYIDRFIAGINQAKDLHNHAVYLIVTGDIADSSKQPEYEQASVVVNMLCKRLSIDPLNVMLLPGNHDINRNLLQVELDKGVPENELYKKHSVKFKFFKNFYDKFYNDATIKFIPDKAIVRTISIPENKLLLIGVNTVYHESCLAQDHMGWIEPECLREELQAVKNSHKDYSSLYKIVFMHHRPDWVNASKNQISNWNHVVSIFEEFGVTNFVSGHNHSYQSYPLNLQISQNYAGCGTFGLQADKQYNSVLLLKHGEVMQTEGQFKFEVVVYTLQNDNSLFWQHITGNSQIAKEFIISIPTIPSPPASSPMIGSSPTISYEEKPQIHATPLESFDEKTDQELIALVKNNNLYHTGHFHWGMESRSHGWIDIGSMINKNKIVSDIVKYYKMIIVKADISYELGTLVGLGMEGNIIGARLSLALNTPYTYYPYSNSMHSKYEKELSTFASDTITIIDLVFYQGDAVKRFVEECRKSLTEIKKINVICLYYTGKANDYTIPDDRCKIIPICTGIRQCPCNVVDVNECSVYEHKLAPIHEFNMNNNN